jgi:hypothetical protein
MYEEGSSTRKAPTSSRQASVCISFTEDLHIQELEDPGVVQGKYAFQDQDMRRVYRCGLAHALVPGKGIDGDLSPLSSLEIAQSLDQHVEIKGLQQP